MHAVNRRSFLSLIVALCGSAAASKVSPLRAVSIGLQAGGVSSLDGVGLIPMTTLPRFFVQHQRACLQAITTGLGVEYGELAGYLSDANYSQMRTNLMNQRDREV